ncbi:MAG: hypothetical protein AAGC68_06260 [Verrucomicrobiota bacterium]
MRNRLAISVLTLSFFLPFARTETETPGSAAKTLEAEMETAGAEKVSFPLLETSEGEIYRDVSVIRADEEGLVFKHEKGVARVSFFHLSSALQERFNFDPVTGMNAYQKNLERERRVRKERMLSEQKRLAALEEEAEKERLYETAQRDWYPIEATIVRSTKDGLYARVWRIIFIPTKEKSTLGFERDGPPRRTTQRYGDGKIFLKGATMDKKTAIRWLGYLDPSSSGFRIDPTTGKKTVPVHLAVRAR